MGWARALVTVICRPASAKIWRGWDSVRVAVHCRRVDVSTFNDCWTDLMNVPVDWASVCKRMTWEADLVAVNSLVALVRSCSGCEMALEAVHSLDVCVRMLRDSCVDFMYVPADWVSAWMVRDWPDSLVAVHCLAVSVRS
jgi:hypothetical protein